MHVQVVVRLSFVLSLLSPSLATVPEDGQHNANHIFNALHSSMRQWGSSLNHNGMSFFLATVPTGTQLYHGTSKSEPVKRMEWLAFEPEHALIFARPHGPPGGGRRPPPGEGDGHGPPIPGGPHPDEWQHGPESVDDNEDGQHAYDKKPKHHPPPPPGPPPHRPNEPPPPPPHHEPIPGPYRPPPPAKGKNPGKHNPPPAPTVPGDKQRPMSISSSEEPQGKGYLHTYAPHKDLRLLYIDGMSAGKTSNGTLDSQDLLLLNLTDGGSHGPMGGEIERAKGLCNLSATLWEDKIDGVLRMEGGFEIILCNFERDLEIKSIMPVVEWRGGSPGGPGGPGRGLMGGWQYYKAITDRYHGIGGGRVVVNYEEFVSAFEYKGLELWENDVQSDVPMPRLQNVGDEDLQKIKDTVTDLILKSEWKQEKGELFDWQQVVDMVITRYSASLHYLSNPTSPVRKSKEAFATYLATLLRPFVDYSARNSTLETERCVAQVLPASIASKQASLAHRSVHAVTTHLCTQLLTSLDVTTLSLSRSISTDSPPPSHALSLIDELVSYLQWTTWKQCSSCGDEEICVIPIWPMGSLEDHKDPRCMGEAEASGRHGYWGLHGPGRGPPPGEDDGRKGWQHEH